MQRKILRSVGSTRNEQNRFLSRSGESENDFLLRIHLDINQVSTEQEGVDDSGRPTNAMVDVGLFGSKALRVGVRWIWGI